MRRILNFPRIVTILAHNPLVSYSKETKKTPVNYHYSISNPTRELAWLKEAIDNIQNDEYSYYVMANYKGQTVFYYGNCNPVANYVSIVRNCNGDHIGYRNELYNKLTDISVIWKHENSKCGL